MKTTRLKNVALGLLAFIAFMFLSVVITPAAAGVAIAMAGGVAISGGITEQGVRTESTTLNMEDISSTVTEMLPANTPLDTIMRKIRKAEKMEAMQHRYYSVASKALFDGLDTAVSGAGTSVGAPASAITASTPGLLSVYVQVLNAAIWNEKDTLLMRGLTLPTTAGVPIIGGSGSTTMDVAFFVASKSGSVLQLVPLNGLTGLVANLGKFVVPSFANTTVLYRMGKAMHEKDASTTAFGIIPDADTQYAQYFMAQVEESTFQKMTKKEVDWGFNDYERQNIYDMKATMEMSKLFGALGYNVNPNNTNQKIYTTKGITRDITKLLNYGTGSTNRSITFAQVIDWCKSTFVGNNGSTSRYLFGGSTLIGALHSVESIQKQVNGKAPVVKWGIEFTEIVTNFGLLYIYHHPLFSATGWADNGLILDLEHIRAKEFMPMGVRPLDLKLAGTSLSDATVISEVSCLTLANPDCHAIIRPTA